MAAKTRPSAIYQASHWLEFGGLLTYGDDLGLQCQRAALAVDFDASSRSAPI